MIITIGIIMVLSFMLGFIARSLMNSYEIDQIHKKTGKMLSRLTNLPEEERGTAIILSERIAGRLEVTGELLNAKSMRSQKELDTSEEIGQKLNEFFMKLEEARKEKEAETITNTKQKKND